MTLCYSHPLHPISRRERWLIFLLQALFTLLITSGLTEATECVACGITTCVANTSVCEDYSSTELSGRRVQEYGPHLVRRPGGHQARQNFPAPNAQEVPADSGCCLCVTTGMVWAMENIYIGDGSSTWFGVAVYNAMINFVFSKLTENLVACNCGQTSREGKFCGFGQTLSADEHRHRCERIGYAVLTLIAVAQVTPAVCLISAENSTLIYHLHRHRRCSQ